MRNVGAEKDFGFLHNPDRYAVTTEKDRFDVYGNRSVILSWGFNEEKDVYLKMEKISGRVLQSL
ncbi:hypothetical protein Hanom_Chr11g01013851 [Helianthus anomalus]